MQIEPVPPPESGMSVTRRLTPAQIRKLVAEKWPEADYRGERYMLVNNTDPTLAWLSQLVGDNGLPAGQVIEITGAESSGKTTLTISLLAAITRQWRSAWVDMTGGFFPSSASAAGVALERLLVVMPETLPMALRTMELLFADQRVRCAVCDLAGYRTHLKSGAPRPPERTVEKLIESSCTPRRSDDRNDRRESFGTAPEALWHRLRQKTVRAGGVVFFVTDIDSGVIPPSMVSLRLEVRRLDDNRVEVVTVRSRISREGMRAEVALCA